MANNGKEKRREPTIVDKIIGLNVKKIREVKGLTQTELEQALGYKSKKASMVSRIERGLRPVGPKLLKKLAKFFNVPPEVLAKPLNHECIPEELLSRISLEDDYVYIPMVEGKISAGKGLMPSNDVIMKLAFRKDWINRIGNPSNMSLIMVEGDSMEPTLLSGDVVLVDHSRNFLSPQGGIYAIVIDDSILIKRIQVLYGEKKVKVISDNPRYESFLISPEELTINGKVIWFCRVID